MVLLLQLVPLLSSPNPSDEPRFVAPEPPLSSNQPDPDVLVLS